ncbi:MAG TPA: DUF4402 domain-containing protein [Croceibacterium sp.]|nr:DUF4402 domain-containing protein [Croceibacterium sp.]
MKSILRSAVAGMAIASFGFASTASAATTDSADVTAEILSTLSVDIDLNADTLDFGTIADSGIAAPTAVTVASDGSLSSCGASLVCAGTTAAPTFNITGLTGALVGVSFVNPSETLTYGGVVPTGMTGTMSVGTFTNNLVGNQITLDGTDSFSVGGTLTVNPLQAPGVYNGTLSVSVAYN